MKNITLTIDDETHRRARVRAAELGTSLSALVKSYLTELADDPLVQSQGMREMPLTFNAAPVAPKVLDAASAGKGPEGQPYFVDGKWVWTKDGKPRRPGAMRGLGGWTKDFDEWPDGFIDAMYGDETAAAENWWKPFATPPEKPKRK